MLPNRRFSWMLFPSPSSLIRHAAIIFLCTSRPQQLRCTLMALLLYLWRRRLHSKILPNELSSWRCHFAVPTASSSNLLNGLLYQHHCDVAGLVASGTPLSLSSRLFSCFVVTGTGHADLLRKFSSLHGLIRVKRGCWRTLAQPDFR